MIEIKEGDWVNADRALIWQYTSHMGAVVAAEAAIRVERNPRALEAVPAKMSKNGYDCCQLFCFEKQLYCWDVLILFFCLFSFFSISIKGNASKEKCMWIFLESQVREEGSLEESISLFLLLAFSFFLPGSYPGTYQLVWEGRSSEWWTTPAFPSWTTPCKNSGRRPTGNNNWWQN